MIRAYPFLISSIYYYLECHIIYIGRWIHSYPNRIYITSSKFHEHIYAFIYPCLEELFFLNYTTMPGLQP